MMIRPSGITISYSKKDGNLAYSRPVVVKIFGFADGQEEAVNHQMVIGAGESAVQLLSEGLYNVELTLPSGRLLQRNVKITQDTHEEFQFLEDFGLPESFSLQESVSAHRVDVLAQALSETPVIEEEVVVSKTVRPRKGLSTPKLKGFAQHSQQRRGIRTSNGNNATLNDVRAVLSLGWNWLPDLNHAPMDWTPHNVSDASCGKFLWQVKNLSDIRSSKFRRQWARVERPDGGIEVASIPLPWPLSGNEGFATADILCDPERPFGAATTIAINDAAMSPLLSFMDRGQAIAAGPILETIELQRRIEASIYTKMANPLAACAAGYVGLAAFPVSQRERYDPWLKTCMEHFPQIPDTAIIYARRLILRPQGSEDNERAADALRQACMAGVPYFSTGVLLLHEMLLQLSSDHQDFFGLAKKIGQLASRTDRSQVFTVLRFAPPEKG